MAKIPDARQLQRVIPTGQAPIARLDTRGSGTPYTEMAGALGRIEEAKTDYEASRARVQAFNAIAEVKRTMKDDPDPDPAAYEAQILESASRFAQEIGNPQARNAFMDDYRVKAIEFRTQAEEFKAERWRSAEQGKIIEQRDQIINNAIEQGAIEEGFTLLSDLYNTAASGGVYGPDGARIAAASKEQDRDALAERYITSLDPRKALKELDSEPVKKHMDFDKREALKRKFKKDAFEVEVVEESDKIMDEVRAGAVPVEALDYRLRDYDDVEFRLALERRVKDQIGFEQQRIKTTQNETMSTLQTSLYERDDQGNYTLTMSKILKDPELRAQYDSLDPAQQRNLMSLQSSLANAAAVSDPNLMVQLAMAAGTRDYDRMMALLAPQPVKDPVTGVITQPTVRLRPEDHISMIKIATEGRTGKIEDSLKAYLEVPKAVNAVVKETLNDKDKAAFIIEMQEWVESEIAKKTPPGGTPVIPSPTEINAEAKKRLIESTRWYSSTRLYEMEAPRLKTELYDSLGLKATDATDTAISILAKRYGFDIDFNDREAMLDFVGTIRSLRPDDIARTKKEVEDLLKSMGAPEALTEDERAALERAARFGG